jgi:hypothetical protein
MSISTTSGRVRRRASIASAPVVQAVAAPGSGRRRGSAAGVGDLDRQPVGPVVHADDGRRAGRVLHRVRQRFLDDPVRRQVDAVRQRDAGPTGHHQIHGESRVADAADQ